ncbi:NADH:flavin oxidoreductase [Proteiniclasticum sp. BAD-10]|uniref:NADH:flavin oxidoreductase n=1 Tax=Proteiniclasticum sediminis TaxID=2804028 RepID=A0A941HQV2_9CLOT|nr:NADH:flavin oxidoreductase [Proteiniclasticum sediminis]MBR0576899.1 NADH:flavin oxidoreductase [Proteiniclasticum sediminis]
MSTFEKFNFRSLEELKEKIKELEIPLGLCEDLDIFKKPVQIHHKASPNALAVLPMEGCDSLPDGSPSDLVKRRYHRFYVGGAGLVWFEANAVVPEGRANPGQMMLTPDNKEAFRALLAELNEKAVARNGYRPLSILQLTHSGRYSRPVEEPAPMIAQHDPYLDPRVGIDETYPVVTDEYLDNLKTYYVRAARLAKEVGFDGVDVKACHRYLVSELLASHTRGGKYGGSFENRSRFLLDTIREIRKAVGEDYIIASRFNVFDAHPYPYGFGVDKKDAWVFDETEPLKLVELMEEAGVNLLSNSAGNPYFSHPEVTRPFDMPTLGGSVPDEHPLVSIDRLFRFSEKIHHRVKKAVVIGNGYSWLRQYAPYAGAYNLKEGRIHMVGMGRSSFAYPDAPRDILLKGAMDPKACCIACSKCTQIMRDYGQTGCVIKDSAIYVPKYTEARERAKARAAAKEGRA